MSKDDSVAGEESDPSFALQTAQTDTQAMQQNATNMFLLPSVDTSANQPLLSATSTYFNGLLILACIDKVDLPH